MRSRSVCDDSYVAMKDPPPFQAFTAVLTTDQVLLLKEKAKELFTAKTKSANERYSSGETFFIAADEEPASVAEEFALAVFRWFSAGTYFDPSQAGAEYWPLVLDERSDQVGAHYDKDYAAERAGEDRYPYAGTVTYLADYGAPTTFFDVREDTPLPCSVPRAWMSRVRSGKVVSFDGRLLHCAPSEMASLWEQPRPGQGPRVTLLVNVWFSRPEDALRCPFVEKDYAAGRLALPNNLGTPDHVPSVDMGSSGSLAVEMRHMGDKNLLLEGSFDSFGVLATKASSVQLQWSPGQCHIHSKKKKPAQKQRRKH